MQRYNPKDIEPKWQKAWANQKIYEASEDASKPKRYVLEYFPYPSGAAMHVGHVRNYTIGDAIARHARMNGYNVLHPMGWDAFGLPAENYAIKNGISPAQAIAENTDKFKRQLTQMGFSYDWSREVNSSDPSYYKWTQWFFKLLLEKGLAYQKDSLQWWCDFDKTVLANEQVEAGKCWRCGNTVSKKALKQWFFKITDYADRLIEDLDKLDWSEAIKSMQRNWIGKSEGAEIDFKIDGSEESVRVFTTRPDTIFGATFMVLAPEHPIVAKITTEDHRQHVNTYVKATEAKSDVERQETDREKTGMFTGAYAINPLNGNKIPVWISDYVLYGYGTGAIMAVPAHDERDHVFAKQFNLPITQVVAPTIVDQDNPPLEGKKDTTRNGAMCVIEHPEDGTYLTLKWNKLPWHSLVMGGIEDGEDPAEAARREITEETGYTDFELVDTMPLLINSKFYARHKDLNRDLITQVFSFKLKSLDQTDLNREAHEDFETLWIQPDKLSTLRPVTELPYILKWLAGDDLIFSGEGVLVNSGDYTGLESSVAREKIVEDIEKQVIGKKVTNYKIRDWLISRQRYWGAPIPVIHCQKDGVVPVPDDQLPVVLPEVESYAPTGEGTSVLASVEDWVNVDCPKCGNPAKRETDTMDGFACSSWYFLRFADPHNADAAFDKDKAKFWLPVDDYIGGAEHAVMHLLYARMWTKVMFDEGLIDFDEPFARLRNQGMILAPDGRKMSKSWGNTITPDEIIDQGYGADAIRVMELFIGPWDQSANWSVEGMGGCFRFLQRVWALVQEFNEATETKETDTQNLNVAINKATKKVSEDLSKMSFNTAISALMECVNDLNKIKQSQGYAGRKDWQSALENLVQLLAPFAPHIAEELWEQLGHKQSVHLSDWPKYDEKYLVQSTIKLAVQVNGKLRGEVEVAADADEETAIEAAKQVEKVAGYLDGQTIKKAIYVKGRLVSFVV